MKSFVFSVFFIYIQLFKLINCEFVYSNELKKSLQNKEAKSCDDSFECEDYEFCSSNAKRSTESHCAFNIYCLSSGPCSESPSKINICKIDSNCIKYPNICVMEKENQYCSIKPEYNINNDVRECIINEHCLSNNCIENKCVLNQNQTMYQCGTIKKSGIFSDNFLKRCGKLDGEYCENDEECFGNKCKDNKCSSNEGTFTILRVIPIFLIMMGAFFVIFGIIYTIYRIHRSHQQKYIREQY